MTIQTSEASSMLLVLLFKECLSFKSVLEEQPWWQQWGEAYLKHVVTLLQYFFLQRLKENTWRRMWLSKHDLRSITIQIVMPNGLPCYQFGYNFQWDHDVMESFSWSNKTKTISSCRINIQCNASRLLITIVTSLNSLPGCIVLISMGVLDYSSLFGPLKECQQAW